MAGFLPPMVFFFFGVYAFGGVFCFLFPPSSCLVSLGLTIVDPWMPYLYYSSCSLNIFILVTAQKKNSKKENKNLISYNIWPDLQPPRNVNGSDSGQR